jgi:hypothetical protein
MVREKEGAKKRREEVHSHRGAVPGEFGEGGSTVNVSGKRLRRRSAQASTKAPDIGVMTMLRMRLFRVSMS